jgi:PAS domain S-box-containing protein
MRWQIESLIKTRRQENHPFRTIFLVLSTSLVTLLLQNFINRIFDNPYFFFFFPAVLFVAWRAGFWAALATMLLCALGANIIFFNLSHPFHWRNWQDTGPLLFVGLSSAICAWLMNLLGSQESIAKLSQQELETTLKSIGDAVMVIDRDKKVTFLNPIAEQLTGWKNIESRGRPMENIFRIINEKTREPATNPVEKALKERTIVGLSNHTVLISKDGIERNIEDSAAPIFFGPHGELAGVVLIFRDVTEKYQTERETIKALKKLEAVVEGLNEGILFADANGSNFQMNLAAMKMYGFSSEADIFHYYEHYKDMFTLQSLDHTAIPYDQWPLARALRGETFHDFEAIVTRIDNGHSFTASYSGTPIQDENGKTQLAVLTIRDITQKALTESELRRAKEEAEKASRMKTSFLANMSHEIRTPMTAVLGFTEVLKNPSLSESEREDALERIDRSGRALLKLIDDILDVAKIESGKIEIQKSFFSPLEVASEVVDLLKLQAEAKGLELRMKASKDFPETACSDAFRIRQILTNLIGNAIKFTSKGHVELCMTKDHKNLVFEVIDTGIGISFEEQKKIFQPFSQADPSVTRRFGGTGLGLVLSREISKTLGGSLTLESSHRGHGSKFVFRVPAEPFKKNHELPA